MRGQVLIHPGVVWMSGNANEAGDRKRNGLKLCLTDLNILDFDKTFSSPVSLPTLPVLPFNISWRGNFRSVLSKTAEGVVNVKV